MLKVGLIGYGKSGKAVAQVLADDPRLELCWIGRREAAANECMETHQEIPIVGLAGRDMNGFLNAHAVDALVDFSHADTLFAYGDEVRRRKLILVSAISSYQSKHMDYLRTIAQHTRVLSSPNITLGINFLMVAARLLRGIAPSADIEIIEQHFRDKPEISGTAVKIAEALSVGEDRITSLRLGGIVGYHEVIFGFRHQTVRLIHNSIRPEAFGTGAAFALKELARAPAGFYTFEDLLAQRVRADILGSE